LIAFAVGAAFFGACEMEGGLGGAVEWPSFTIAYNANGGIENSVHRHGATLELNANAFIREGHSFAGWARTPNGAIEFTDRQSVYNLATRDGEVITLFARWRAHTHTVVYNANGGDGHMAATVFTFDVAGYLRPNAFTRAPETFLGWSRSPNGHVEFRDGESVRNLTAIDEAVITLYARWGSGPYTVTFDINNGTGTVPDPQTVNAGSGMTLPGGDGFSRIGFTFAGWNTTSDGTGANFNAHATFTPTGNVTLFAKWIVTVTVTFDGNGGTGEAPAPQTVRAGNAVTIPGSGGLSRSGFTFAGWNTLPDGTGAHFSAGASYTPTGNFTLYARWIPIGATNNFTVSFNANGGAGTVPEQRVAEGSSITLPGAGGLSRAGHRFVGWNTRPDGTGDDLDAGATFRPTANTVLYARWTAFFTITFNANGGTGDVPAPQTVDEGSQITFPDGDGLSRDGFTFAGWNTLADGTGVNFSAGTAHTPIGNTVVYANWVHVDTGSSFTVTFNANGGTGTPPAPRIAPAGSAITLPGDGGLLKAGHTFGGWNTSADGMGTNFDVGAEYIPSGNITLYARWITITIFTVTFDVNGGEGTAPLPQTVAEGSAITLPGGGDLSKAGYAFGGWNTNAAGTGANFNVGATYTPNGNVTFYARWIPIFTVTFNANSGTGIPPAPQTVTQGSGITLPDAGGLTRSWHIFGGWNTNAAGTGTNFNVGATHIPSGSMVLYARWIAITAFTVTFDANEGTGTVPMPQTVAAGTSITIPGSGDLSRAGYAFGGWNTNAAGTGANFNVGATYTPSGNVTLYARWIPIFTVTFNANSGTGTPPAPQTVNQGSGITIPGGGDLSRAGYAFGGWNTNTAGTGANFNVGATYTPSGNVTLYARWIAITIFTVTFNANEGTGTAPIPQTVAAGSSITLPGGGGLSKTRHVFGGWNTNAAGTGTNFNAGTSFMPDGNVTLYARWVAVFTVTFNANNGTGTAPAPQTVNQGSSITLPGAGGLTRSGYTFGGWNTSADGTGTNFNIGALHMPNGSMVLYARWIAITIFTVTFNANGGAGTAPIPQTVAAGSGITLPGAGGLSKAGRVFGGWNTNAAGTGTSFSVGASFTPEGNVTLYAMWIAMMISAGGTHTVAIRDGELWTWGNNANGQLGDGTTTQRITPTRIGEATNWVHVSAGDSHTMAIRADGSLWAWGNAAEGRTGLGLMSGNTTTPFQVGTALDWVYVSAGTAHTLGIRRDGSLWAWGNNGSGRLGIGNTTNQNLPQQVGTDTNWACVDKSRKTAKISTKAQVSTLGTIS